MQLEELSGVMLDFDGAPVGFRYRNQEYLVSSKPVRWYSRKLWWDEAVAAPKGTGAALLEIEMWRLWAATKDSSAFFELKHTRPEDSWQVSQINI
ncbi:MAG: hypothetical protein RL068_391 [Actinomycetota bacterium]|jgi:hypothetical protein